MTKDFAPPSGSSSEPSDQRPTHTGGPLSSHPGQHTAVRSSGAVRITAWVAIAAGVALLIGMSWSAALAYSDRAAEPAAVTETGDLDPLAVVPGMCLEDVGDDGPVGGTSVVPCDEPHKAEVFTSFVYTAAKYPGDSDTIDEALSTCATRLEGLLPQDASWVAWAPSEASWARGDRTAMCVAVFEEPLSEPLSPAGIKASETPEAATSGQDA